MTTDQSQLSLGPCCFCGKQIEATEVDPCRVTVETSRGMWQVWFCHADCFKSRITNETELDLSPAHF
jgi:hypothetical protein